MYLRSLGLAVATAFVLSTTWYLPGRVAVILFDPLHISSLEYEYGTTAQAAAESEPHKTRLITFVTVFYISRVNCSFRFLLFS